MSKIIPVKIYPSRAEANLAKGLLEENGIKATISADDYGGVGPHVLMGMGGARLMVREEDKEAAMHLLEDEISRA